MRLVHRVVYAVEQDIASLQFNTAIAKMMEFMNGFSALPRYPRKGLQMFTQILYPFAPHIAEEAWQALGEKESLTYLPYPKIDPKYLEDDSILYVAQVNGKLRGKWLLPKEMGQEEVVAFMKAQPPVAKYLTGQIQKVVFVPGKLINIVVT